MVTVTFKKSPTGKPWFLAYSVGDQGLVLPQKAAALLEAGIIEPIELVDEIAEAADYVPVATVEESGSKEIDLSTIQGVKEQFGTNLDELKAYCDDHKIKYGKAAKRPEYFWSKIAKHNA